MNYPNIKLGAPLLVLAFAASGCILRNVPTYTTDVRSVLEGQSGEIRSCYDAQVTGDAPMAGDVVVNFEVAKKTGEVSNVAVDPSSTAPEALSTCVASALGGLVLDPGDMAPATATFTWRFSEG